MPSHPPIDQQITFLYTTDLAQTADFYENIMGFTLWRDQGSCRIYRVSGDGLLGFCERDVPQPVAGPENDRLIVTIVSPQVDAWYELLCERGVEFTKPPAINKTYNIYHCFLRDPNGYLIEIQRFLD